ncbi:hypothetical protein OE88DRAFT_1102732 [Heliocybe sulcata]|uniref:Uncharacterized protein n=1 Tax=Heliocybe sulcata TaxID=5364 RepID=A0A5C3MK47_9AGAM|nr:hypothetical protein OE88DRAFT_1102732 [Heliocybe sulcata]
MNLPPRTNITRTLPSRACSSLVATARTVISSPAHKTFNSYAPACPLLEPPKLKSSRKYLAYSSARRLPPTAAAGCTTSSYICTTSSYICTTSSYIIRSLYALARVPRRTYAVPKAMAQSRRARDRNTQAERIRRARRTDKRPYRRTRHVYLWR